MSETSIQTSVPEEPLHPNILAIARLLGRQAATTKYLPSAQAMNCMQGNVTNDNENANEAGSNLRTIQ